MARVLTREAAKRDLIAQWGWYAEKAGVETPDRFLAAADATPTMLASQPAHPPEASDQKGNRWTR
ncbi:MAG: type II toxin-antitoxin system RelE/ParE family toxin [Bryobacterales bacterium]|nr:type II toxin-antitoxin system RelE/ParE family toxin [Bryobacterales bacterium]